MTVVIPQFEPEVIDADARRRGGDLEKVATTSLDEHIAFGVRLTSRYQKAHELRTMALAVSDLPGPWREKIRSLDCDSKHMTYSMKMQDGCNTIMAGMIGRELCQRIAHHALCCAGIYITGSAGLSIDIEGSYGE